MGELYGRLRTIAYREVKKDPPDVISLPVDAACERDLGVATRCYVQDVTMNAFGTVRHIAIMGRGCKPEWDGGLPVCVGQNRPCFCAQGTISFVV